MQVYLKKQNFFFQRTVIKIAILALVIVALNIFFLQAKNIFYKVSSPISAALWHAGDSVSYVFSPLLNFKKIQNDNINLQAENQKLVSQLFTLEESNLQHQEYQSAQQNAAAENISITSAKITSLDAANDQATLNKGSTDGIAQNMAVVSSQNVLYGKISKVYKNFSEVMLVSNKASVADVKVVGAGDSKTPVYGAVKGSGNLSLYLDLVDSNVKIQEGEPLATSGLDGIFPAGILLGNIAKVNQNDLKPFQTALVSPLASPQSIENVFIVTKKQ